MDLEELTFVSGIELANGQFILAAQDPALRENEVPHTGLVCRLSTGEWDEIGLFEHATASMAKHESEDFALLLSPEGLVTDADHAGTGDCEIRGGGAAPPGSGFRCIAQIGDSVFAGGLRREVWCRTDGQWAKVSTAELENTGRSGKSIEAIDGLSREDVTAVGFDGEIWGWDGNSWKQEPSPTTHVLTSVAVGEDQRVAAGLGGVVLSRKDDQWLVVEHDVEDDFWSAAWFDGACYLSTEYGIYELSGSTLREFRPADEDMRTCYSLTVGLSGLWSIGPTDIALYDGTKWHMIAQS